jgi:hypothetical protein
VPVNEAIVLAIKGREAAGLARGRGEMIDEGVLEAAGRADPRRGRWGMV